MEFFNSAKAVRLQSHLGKYLQANDDKESVGQTRNGATPHVCWAVELVAGKPHVIHLKSCFGKYLTASGEPFMLGTAGKKVLQADPGNDEDWEWEPRKDGFFVKLRTRAGLFLRANGGAPPWRNSVTHDIPRRRSTQEWVLWSVDVVDDIVTAFHYSSIAAISPAESFSSNSSFSSVSDYDLETPSPSMSISSKDLSAMELFQRARVVRLRSHHNKYLVAEDDEESVCQDRNGLVKNARWTVEFVEHSDRLCLMSCFGKYLISTSVPFLLGMTGKKVLQTVPQCYDSNIEWEPIREGFQVKLKTSHGQFLRANGGLPPWRNSITHDIPHRTATQDWVLWDVDVVENRIETILPPHNRSTSTHKSSESLDLTPVKARGRVICYHVANENGDVVKEEDEVSFVFKGSQVHELKERLKEETGINDFVVCSRNPLNGTLYPLRLHLPPNNTDIHIVVVPSSSDIEELKNLQSREI